MSLWAGVVGFPNEIWINILSRLDGLLDILACEITCRHLRSLIANSSELQYLKERLSTCTSLSPSRAGNVATSATLLRELKQNCKAWSGFDFVLEFELVLPLNVDSFALRGEMLFCTGIAPKPHPSLQDWEGLTHINVDLEHRGIKTWRYDETGRDLVFLQVSEEDDLLLYIEWHADRPKLVVIRVRDLHCVFRPHGSTKKSRIYLKCESPDWSIGACTIVGAHIVLLVCSGAEQVPTPDLRIVNWRTGFDLKVPRSCCKSKALFVDIVGLDRSTFVVMTTKGLDILSFEEAPGNGEDLVRHVVSLKLPPRYAVKSFVTSTVTDIIPESVHYTDPEERILAMQLKQVIDGFLIIQHRFLLQLAHALGREVDADPAADRAHDGVPTLAWREWGEHNTQILVLSDAEEDEEEARDDGRVVERDPYDDFFVVLSGARFFVFFEGDDGFAVYDFQRHCARTPKSSESHTKSRHHPGSTRRTERQVATSQDPKRKADCGKDARGRGLPYRKHTGWFTEGASESPFAPLPVTPEPYPGHFRSRPYKFSVSATKCAVCWIGKEESVVRVYSPRTNPL